MPDTATTHEFAQTAAPLRRLNRATVEKYLATTGVDRLHRHQLYTPDGSAALLTTDSGNPIVIQGRERLAAHAVWSLKCFPDWQWHNIQVFETQDPNHLWAECDGHGQILFPGYPAGFYSNHFLHSFQLQDGLITQSREFMNPINQLRALNIPTPEITREGLPT